VHRAPVASAIIIFLDEAEFLSEAIDSVLAQSHTDWELLLVDDGSTDGSTEIAESYARRHPDRIRCLTHPDRENRGMSASRNLGLREATGRYVAYLDGDDVWLPTKLEEQVAILEALDEVDAVYGPLTRWRTWADPEAEESIFGFGRDGQHPYIDRVVEAPKLVSLFLDDVYFIPGGLLMRREAAIRDGGFEEEFTGMYEDAVFLVKLLLRSSVFVSSRPTYLYRMHPESCTHVAGLKGEQSAAERRYLRWIEEYLASSGMNAPEVRRSLRRASFRVRYPAIDALRRPRRTLRRVSSRAQTLARRAASAPKRAA
jgi:glycosyltransferase involved in cell wall biosynthesis